MSTSKSKLTRRALISSAATGLALTVTEFAQENPPQDALPPADQTAVDAKYANVIRKYGDRLDDAQRTRVRRTLVQHQRMLMRVRDFPLDNGDAPATGLRLYPTDVPGNGERRD